MDRLSQAIEYTKVMTKNRLKNYTDNRYIYLLKCGEFYKAGIASNLRERLFSYKVHNPYPIQVIASTKVMNYKRYEKWVMSMFRSKHHHGEWYQLDQSDIDKIMSRWFIGLLPTTRDS